MERKTKKNRERIKFKSTQLKILRFVIGFIYLFWVHERIHENKLLHCHFCQFKSSQHNSMIDHLDVHLNLLKFNCEFCDRKFPRQCGLSNHVSRYHESDIFKCLICSSVFKARMNVINHLRKTHKITGDFHPYISRPKFRLS